MKISPLNRLLLLLTCLLAAYEIAVGIDAMGTLPILAYTVGFGVLLVAGLLFIILGYEALDSPVVVVISTVIPLSLALGLVWETLASWRIAALTLAGLGFLAVVLTRGLGLKNRLPVVAVTLAHGVSGMVIFLLPLVWTVTGRAAPAFALVGLGGALIGTCGLALSFLGFGRPVLPRQTILKLLPVLLLLTTAAFVAGFHFGG